MIEKRRREEILTRFCKITDCFGVFNVCNFLNERSKKMKKVCLAILVLMLSVGLSSSIGATITLEQSDGHNYGNYAGGCWKISDAGFSVSGGSLTQQVSLKSVSYKRHRIGSGGTPGWLWLKVFEGNNGGNGTFIGISSNKLDFGALQDGEIGTWTFDNVVLDKDTVYSFVASSTNDSSNPSAVMRMKTSHPNDVLTSGNLLFADDTKPDYDSDPWVKIEVENVPEPATVGLLMLGGLLFRVRR